MGNYTGEGTNTVGSSPLNTLVSHAAATLQVAAQADFVILTTINSLPKVVHGGVQTKSELGAAFTLAKSESRKAFYTPVDSGVVGHALGSLAAGLTVAPSGRASGSSSEDYLARADYYVSQGDLRGALKELCKLEGSIAAGMADWMEAARARLLVEQAARLIGAHATTLSAIVSCGLGLQHLGKE